MNVASTHEEGPTPPKPCTHAFFAPSPAATNLRGSALPRHSPVDLGHIFAARHHLRDQRVPVHCWRLRLRRPRRLLWHRRVLLRASCSAYRLHRKLVTPLRHAPPLQATRPKLPAAAALHIVKTPALAQRPLRIRTREAGEFGRMQTQMAPISAYDILMALSVYWW